MSSLKKGRRQSFHSPTQRLWFQCDSSESGRPNTALGGETGGNYINQILLSY
jgi:hypothetical protein